MKVINALATCTTIIAAIFGIAYPILLQVVSHLDEKYKSIRVNNLFFQQWPAIWFERILIFVLTIILLSVLELPPQENLVKVVPIIENSAPHVLLISSVLLIFVFYRFVNMVLVYYSPYKFLLYLIRKNNNSKPYENLEYFETISDLFHLAIREQNTTIINEITKFAYTSFKQVREAGKTKPVTFPLSYYRFVYDAINEIAPLNSRRLKGVELHTSGSVWFLGEFEHSIISENTYAWIWQNLIAALDYNRDDLIFQHWKTAHQYMSDQLKRIPEDYHYDEQTGRHTITNEPDVKSRTDERERFREFHFALGGLLLYRKQYNCIRKIFSYTQNIPPEYPLLPISMDEVFNQYFKFKDPFNDFFPFISEKYPFPDLDGLMDEYIINKWICSYIALLLIRQYTLVPHYIYQAPLAPPAFPNSQSTLKMWIDNLDYFKKLIGEEFRNKELMKILGYDILTPEWFTSNEMTQPEQFIENVKNRALEQFDQIEREQDVSPRMVQEFKDKSREILLNAMDKFDVIRNTESHGEDSLKQIIRGSRQLIDKSGFAENQGVTLIDFDRFLASYVAEVFQEQIAWAFYVRRTKSYVLKPEYLFPAIDKLNLNKKEHVILVFSQNLFQFEDKVSGLNPGDYKGIPLHKFNITHPAMGPCFIILKSKDLPNIDYTRLDEDYIAKYELTEISDEKMIYAGVVNIHNNEILREELKKSDTERDIDKSILIVLDFNTELTWKKDMPLIYMRLTNPFREQGLINDRRDVTPFTD